MLGMALELSGQSDLALGEHRTACMIDPTDTWGCEQYERVRKSLRR